MFFSLIEHIFYEIDLDTVTSVSNAVENPNFEMQLIPGTNAYLVTRQADSMSPHCPCLDPVSFNYYLQFVSHCHSNYTGSYVSGKSWKRVKKQISGSDKVHFKVL